jgi:hypothetical protein
VDISNLHTHGDYFPVIELTLTASQRNQLTRRGSSDQEVTVSIHETTAVGDGPDVPKVCMVMINGPPDDFKRKLILALSCSLQTTLTALVGVHGKGTLSCQRKSLEVNLPEKVRIAGKRMKKMVLISQCQDASYVKMYSTMHIAQKLNLWKAFFHWIEVRWKVDGHVESRGVYIMNMRIEVRCNSRAR